MPISAYEDAQLDANNTVTDWLNITNQMIADFANIVVSPQQKYLVSNTEPTANLEFGDLWADPDTQSLSMYTSTGFLTIIDDLSPYIQKADNLSDLANTEIALDNLGGVAKADNLSDLANTDISKTNLGLGTGDTPTFDEIILGTDNLSRTVDISGGRVSFGYDGDYATINGGTAKGVKVSVDNGTNALIVDANGDISVSGTIDGRDISTDGETLDIVQGWGDHANAGYLTDISAFEIDALSNVSLANNSADEILVFDGTNFVNKTLSEADIALASSLGNASSFDKATNADIFAGTANTIITADLIESACEPVTISGASNWTPNWSAFVVAEWVVTANRTVLAPTNLEIGTTRYVIIKGSTTTDRTISWASNYKGNLPDVAVDSNTVHLLVSMTAVSASLVSVSFIEYAP